MNPTVQGKAKRENYQQQWTQEGAHSLQDPENSGVRRIIRMTGRRPNADLNKKSWQKFKHNLSTKIKQEFKTPPFFFFQIIHIKFQGINSEGI
jgi:hypothetical protein